eukprot:SAG11_NODE_9623_length_895_cov_1.222362_1_plen_265_part_01
MYHSRRTYSTVVPYGILVPHPSQLACLLHMLHLRMATSVAALFLLACSPTAVAFSCTCSCCDGSNCEPQPQSPFIYADGSDPNKACAETYPFACGNACSGGTGTCQASCAAAFDCHDLPEDQCDMLKKFGVSAGLLLTVFIILIVLFVTCKPRYLNHILQSLVYGREDVLHDFPSSPPPRYSAFCFRLSPLPPDPCMIFACGYCICISPRSSKGASAPAFSHFPIHLRTRRFVADVLFLPKSHGCFIRSINKLVSSARRSCPLSD